jgi:hypothetical protein
MRTRVRSFVWILRGFACALVVLLVGAATMRSDLAQGKGGCRWKPDRTASFHGYPSYLTAASADSVSDIWAVGEFAPANTFSKPVGTITEHWNGKTWVIGFAIDEPSGETHFNGVSALSPSDVWAAGWYGPPFSGPIKTLAERFDGSSWSVLKTQNGSGDAADYFEGALALSDTDVWAVGAKQTASRSNPRTLAEHWNGRTWAVVATDNLTHYGNVLSGVAGSGRDDIWAVGQAQATTSGALAEHWDGRKWKAMPLPGPSGLSGLSAVTEVAPNDVWAVGSTLSTSPPGVFTLIEHWDGSGWTVVKSPNVKRRFWNSLNGVSHSSSTDVWAAGYWETQSSGGPSGPLVEHWDGKTWRIVPASNPHTSGGFGAIAEASPSNVWAVGGFAVASGVNSTLVESYCR